MHIRVEEDTVEIEGYVNAIERNSKPLWSRLGRFVERICKGAFQRAIKRNGDIHILLNHDWDRDLGSTEQGNLELKEDNIGLHARATITDKEIAEEARNGDLVGWSFGFDDIEPGGVERRVIDGMETRVVKDLYLKEVSILDRRKSPAYEGTLINTRSEKQERYFKGEDFFDDVVLTVIPSEPKEVRSTPKEEPIEAKPTPTVEEKPIETKTTPTVKEKPIDYLKYENLIKEMKGKI